MSEEKGKKNGQTKIEIKRGITPDPLEIDQSAKKKKRKAVFVSSRKRRIPPWFFAALIFTFLMAGLFFIVPRLSGRSLDFDLTPQPQETLPEGWDDYLRAEDTAVVTTASASVFLRADASSERVAEAILNEHVTMTDTSDRVFIKVSLDDGVTGYIKRSQLTADTSSISPEGAIARVVIRVPFKRVMSHARSGSLMVEAPMGAVLYADYRNGDLLRVRLPDSKTGWINTTGVMLVPPLALVLPEDNLQQLLVVTMMAFYNSPVVPGGVTARGISAEGAMHVAGLLNGLRLSRDRDRLFNQGAPVSLPAREDGLPDLGSMAEGDMVFFHSKTDREAISAMAMRVTDGQLLIASAGRSTFRLIDIESVDALELSERLLGVRRYGTNP